MTFPFYFWQIRTGVKMLGFGVLLVALSSCGGGGDSAPIAASPKPNPATPPTSSAADYVLTITNIGLVQANSTQFHAGFIPQPPEQTAASNDYELTIHSAVSTTSAH